VRIGKELLINLLPRSKDASSLKDATKAEEFALLPLLYCPLMSLVMDKLNRSPAYSSMEVLNEKVYVYATFVISSTAFSTIVYAQNSKINYDL